MSHKKKNFFQRLLSSSRLSMLASTMFGVIAGIYLTNYFEKRQLYVEKNQALERVKKEISENENDLKKYYEVLSKKYHAVQYITPWLDVKEELLVIPKDSLDSFQTWTKDIFTFNGAEPYGNDQLKISGSLDLTIEPGSTILFTGLSHVVWEAYKEKNFLQVTDFNCMTNIEDLYKFQKEFDLDNKEWVSTFFKGEFFSDSETTNGFLMMWNRFLLKQSLLLQYYEGGRANLLDNCN